MLCLALAIIPLACFYVDLLCRHLSLRNKAIGKFIASHDSGDEVLKSYENFYDRISRDVWDLVSFESVALLGSLSSFQLQLFRSAFSHRPPNLVGVF